MDTPPGNPSQPFLAAFSSKSAVKLLTYLVFLFEKVFTYMEARACLHFLAVKFLFGLNEQQFNTSLVNTSFREAILKHVNILTKVWWLLFCHSRT